MAFQVQMKGAGSGGMVGRTWRGCGCLCQPFSTWEKARLWLPGWAGRGNQTPTSQDATQTAVRHPQRPFRTPLRTSSEGGGGKDCFTFESGWEAFSQRALLVPGHGLRPSGEGRGGWSAHKGSLEAAPSRHEDWRSSASLFLGLQSPMEGGGKALQGRREEGGTSKVQAGSSHQYAPPYENYAVRIQCAGHPSLSSSLQGLSCRSLCITCVPLLLWGSPLFSAARVFLLLGVNSV